MDLSSNLSSRNAMMMALGAGGGNAGGGGGGGAVACPVCTLYLREGISLQKHLDTHPKEQVIEALIRASSTGGYGASLFGQGNAGGGFPQFQSQPQLQTGPPPGAANGFHQQFHTQPQMQTQPQPGPQLTAQPQLPHQSHAQMPLPAPNQNAVPPSASPQQHVPHVPNQSPYPIGPVFECPPVNAMMPPQFASFSYQQFVNNGTMMIPAQYAMAASQPQTPQGNPMMQMLYNPYAMYHQQQLPTVQMISPMQQQMQQPPATTAPTSVVEPTTRTSQTTATTVIETPPTISRPQPTGLTVAEEPKQVTSNEAPVSESILPEIECPSSPEPDDPPNPMENRVNSPVQSREEPSQETCNQPNEQMNLHYQRQSPTITETHNMDEVDDETSERILPEIEDAEEIAPRGSSREQAETEEPATDPIATDPTCDKQLEEHENLEKDQEVIAQDTEMSVQETETVLEDPASSSQIPEPESTTCHNDEQPQTSSSQRADVDQLDSYLINMIETEFSNVEIDKGEEERSKSPEQPEQDPLPTKSSDMEVDMQPQEDQEEENRVNEDEDDGPSHSTPRDIFENCRLVNDDQDSSSSEDEMDCELELLEQTKVYRYKFSRSVPTSPTTIKHPQRSLSRASLRSEYGSGENLSMYAVGFEPTSLQDYLQDNYDPEDMELEHQEDHSDYEKSSLCLERNDVPIKKRRKKLIQRKTTQFCEPEHVDVDVDIETAGPSSSVIQTQEEQEAEADAQESLSKRDIKNIALQESKSILISSENSTEDQPADFRTQQFNSEYTNQFSADSHHKGSSSTTHETFPLSNNTQTSQHMLNISEFNDPSTSIDSKSYSRSKSIIQKPSTELLNINEDAHPGPMNVFEFDGLQLLVPSTFITESSQKAVSATSHQSSNSETGACNDEEVRSVNMRADETMPPRGELSEQESNGCTEQSAWQLYMGQDSSRMSTSYDLMARESWEESEGSENEMTGPLLDSRSLATHFTSSLFLDRDRKTPTRRIFKCSHCPEVFECPKERRVHSTLVHKEPGPSSSREGQMDPQDLKELKILESRTNVFEDIFAQGLHVQQAYHYQQPLLHQLQPPQHISGTKDTDRKDSLSLTAVIDVTCSLCNQHFTSEKSLQLHHRRMHVLDATKRLRENAKCQICNEEFNSVAAFNLHLKIHPLECGQCGKYFQRKQNFKLHMKRHLGIKPFPCTICDKAFLTKQKLDEHMNGHTGNAPVKCNLCNETFRRYSNLTQHKNRHHLNIKKKLKDYICHCGEVFHTKKKLAWHKETHEEKPKACTYCNERFIHMASLTRHMRRAHNRRFVPDAQRDNENVECPICKCIYLRSSLAVHMRVHNGERPYECQVCSKAFSTKWNLQLHKWTHAARSTKPFKCNQCSSAFYRHSDYTAHMNSHRNVRPYTCNYCGAQFIRKYNCLRHVKEHEENKQYTCDICSKTFHRSYYLKEHLRVHSGARPYTCHICGKSSSTKSNHNKHVRIHHAREPVNTEN